jgi:hypothetical protein
VCKSRQTAGAGNLDDGGRSIEGDGGASGLALCVCDRERYWSHAGGESGGDASVAAVCQRKGHGVRTGLCKSFGDVVGNRGGR